MWNSLLPTWLRPSKAMTNFSWTCAFLCICLLFFYYSINNDFKSQTTMEVEQIGNVQAKKLLRIAQVAPLYETVPPKNYGGTERVVSYLTEELVRRGHQVTLFASNNSVTKANLIAKWPNLNDNKLPVSAAPWKWMMNQVKERANQFDILHFHTEHAVIGTVKELYIQNKSVIVMTAHSPNAHATVPYVSISLEQRKNWPSTINFIGNVYHGIPRDLYKFVEKPAEKKYLAFMGRFYHTKAPDWAIEIAVKSGLPLKMAAKIEAGDIWKSKIKGMVEKHSDLVEYVGEINDTQKNAFLGNAYAFLFPINWAEPFGLVMIEAMACGTPVIARQIGSVPEIIDAGVTGLLFNTTEQAVKAIGNIDKMNRAKIRQTFERRFTVDAMVDGYEQIYYRMLGIE